MEELGFICDSSANIADFLTGVTVPHERKIRAERQASAPRTADQIRGAYNKSSTAEKMIAEYSYPTTQVAKDYRQEH